MDFGLVTTPAPLRRRGHVHFPGTLLVAELKPGKEQKSEEDEPRSQSDNDSKQPFKVPKSIRSLIVLEKTKTKNYFCHKRWSLHNNFFKYIFCSFSTYFNIGQMFVPKLDESIHFLLAKSKHIWPRSSYVIGLRIPEVLYRLFIPIQIHPVLEIHPLVTHVRVQTHLQRQSGRHCMLLLREHRGRGLRRSWTLSGGGLRISSGARRLVMLWQR